MKTPYTKYEHKSGYTENVLQILNNSSEAGYAVSIPNKSADKSNTWNAALLDNASRAYKMWVYEIQMDFGLSGITGQSRHRRQFFPVSFNQTAVSVRGQMPNQKEYNKLAAFVRESHAIALETNHMIYQRNGDKQYRASSAQPELLKLYINPYRSKAGEVGLDQKNQNPSGAFKKGRKRKNIKGHHKQLVFEGYIKNISAGALKFNFAPEFQFDFIVAQAYLGNNVGIYDDTLDTGSQLMDWTSQLNTYGFGQQSSFPVTKTKSSNSSPSTSASKVNTRSTAVNNSTAFKVSRSNPFEIFSGK